MSSSLELGFKVLLAQLQVLIVVSGRPRILVRSGLVFGYPSNSCTRDMKAQSQGMGTGKLAWQRLGLESIEPVLKMWRQC